MRQVDWGFMTMSVSRSTYTHLIEVVKEVLSQRDHEPPAQDDDIGSADDYEIIGKSPAHD